MSSAIEINMNEEKAKALHWFISASLASIVSVTADKEMAIVRKFNESLEEKIRYAARKAGKASPPVLVDEVKPQASLEDALCGEGSTELS